MVFLKLRQEPGVPSRVTTGMALKTGVCLATSRLLSSCEGHLRILLKAWQGNKEPLPVRWESKNPFPVATGILGFLSIFKSQTSSPFEALNSTFLSSCQRDVWPPVEMRQGTRAFPRVSTGDSDIPSYCEMKDEPEFKSVQGNQDLCRVRASRCSFHLRQQTQGPSHIPMADRSLLLRYGWKVGIPLEVTQGNQSSS